MFDYTKIRLENIDINRLLNNPILDFNTNLSLSTGEFNEFKRIAKYHFCTIEIIEKKKGGFIVYFKGSIHKMWNSLNDVKAPSYNSMKVYKGYNGNLFTIKDALEMRKHLENLFDCQPEQMFFENVELGVNTNIKFSPYLFINFVLFYRDKRPEFKFKSNYVQFELEQYFIKIYNKSSQYGMKHHTLRFELKVRKMRELKKVGIVTFADITYSLEDSITKFLLDKFDEVMYHDCTVREDELSSLNQKKYSDYSDTNKWLTFYDFRRKNREKSNLKKIIRLNSDNLKLQIRNEIVEKCREIHKKYNEVKCREIHNSTIRRKTPKLCSVTGVNISMQKESSIMLSYTGIRYYYKNDKNIFNKLAQRHLLDRWKNSDLEVQFYHLIHNIRDVKRNREVRQRKIYPQNQYRLFSVSPELNPNTI